MKNIVIRSCVFVLACSMVSASFANEGTIDVLAEGGYSRVNFAGDDFTGGNASVKVLFPISNISKHVDYVLGGGVRYERSSFSGSGYNYNYTSTLTSYELGADTGFKFKPIPQFTAYATASLYIAPSTKYENSITVNGVTNQVDPEVNSNWNIGVGLKGMYNITSTFGIGAGVYVARGVMSYDNSNYNGYLTQGSSGGYNIFNYNIAAAYYID